MGKVWHGFRWDHIPTIAEKLARLYPGGEPDECWIWPFKHKEGTYVGIGHTRIHIASFETFKEVLKEGNVVCHSCDVKDCWNPGHLWQGTQRQNVHDMWAKGRGVPGTWRKYP